MTVYHEGERLVQKRIGVEYTANSVGRMVQDFIPQGFDLFFNRQSIVVIASTDETGCLWASLVTGSPAMIQVADQKSLDPGCSTTRHPASCNDSFTLCKYMVAAFRIHEGYKEPTPPPRS